MLSRDAKVEFLELLAEKDRRRAHDPLKYANCYLPLRHEKQIAFHESTKRLRIVFGGNRTGKTEGNAQEVARYALGQHEFRPTKPGDIIYCFCPSFDVQEVTTQLKLLKYIPESRITDKSFIRNKILRTLTTDFGVTLVFKSYEQGWEKAQGAGLRLVWFDEEPPKEVYKEATMRHEAGQQLDIILSMTPVRGMTWVYDDLYLATNRSDLDIFEYDWDDNPYLSAAQKEEMASGLTEEELLVRKSGRFVQRVGLVCPWWDRGCVDDDIEINQNDWNFYECLDPGWSDPTAYLLVGIDGTGIVHVIDGFREPQIEEQEIFKRRELCRHGNVIKRSVIDSNNPMLTNKLGEVSGYAMNFVPVQKIVQKNDGSWDETLSRALSHFGKSGRLKISKNLPWLIQEIENLFWLQTKHVAGEETKPQWDDHRRFGHHFDGIRALSYLLVSEVIEPVSKPIAPKRIKGSFDAGYKPPNENYSEYSVVEDGGAFINE